MGTRRPDHHATPSRRIRPDLRPVLPALAPAGQFGAARPAGRRRTRRYPALRQPRPRRADPTPQGFDPRDNHQADEIARLLDDNWTVVINEIRPRTAPAPAGTHHTHDTVLRAQTPAVTGAPRHRTADTWHTTPMGWSNAACGALHLPGSLTAGGPKTGSGHGLDTRSIRFAIRAVGHILCDGSLSSKNQTASVGALTSQAVRRPSFDPGFPLRDDASGAWSARRAVHSSQPFLAQGEQR